MTFKAFEEFQNELLAHAKNMGATKGKEYAYDHKDRFQNFNDEAKDMKVSRLLVAYIFVDKHIRSLRSFILNERTYSNETIQDRIADIIVYMTLIAGMIHEDEIDSCNTAQMAVPKCNFSGCPNTLGESTTPFCMHHNAIYEEFKRLGYVQ